MTVHLVLPDKPNPAWCADATMPTALWADPELRAGAIAVIEADARLSAATQKSLMLDTRQLHQVVTYSYTFQAAHGPVYVPCTAQKATVVHLRLLWRVLGGIN